MTRNLHELNPSTEHKEKNGIEARVTGLSCSSPLYKWAQDIFTPWPLLLTYLQPKETIFVWLFFFSFLFRAVPTEYAGSYAAATTPWDPSWVCELYHSSGQCQILNPLREARDRTGNLMVLSWICFCCAMTGTHWSFTFKQCTHLITLWCLWTTLGGG